MRKPWFYAEMMMIVAVMAGCHLSNPPECYLGDQKCVDEGLSSILLSCNSEHQWDRMMCMTGCADDKKKCREIISVCSSEDEVKCVQTSSGVNLELKCMHGGWIPSICASGSHCENNRCTELDSHCNSGETMCLDDVNGYSLAIGCNTEGYWESMYCPTTTCDARTKKCKIQNESVCVGRNDGDSCDKGNNTVATCYNGTCVSTGCANGYHRAETGCMADSKDACGNAATDCTKIAHVDNVECERGICVVTSCADSYEVVNKTACVAAGALSCGEANTNCTLIPNVADVNCSSGKCEVLSCVPGMHPNPTKDGCDPDTLAACGSDLKDCSAIDDARQVKCENGHCVVSDCLYGKHVSEDMSRCVGDEKTACGFEGIDCTKLNGVSESSCVDGVCKIQSCKSGMHIATGGQSCEQDTEENCGSSHTNCKSISNAKDVSCVSGACKVTSCNSGHHPDSIGSRCESDNVSSCNGINCKSENVLSATCESGTCVVSSCNIGYHVSQDKTKCVSDADECLASLYIDTQDGIYKNSNVKCINGDVTMAGNTKQVELPALETVSGKICNRNNCTNGNVSAEGLKTISMPKLETSGGFLLWYSLLTEINFPSLTTSEGYISILYNPELTRINAPALVSAKGITVYANTIDDGTYLHSNLKTISMPKLVSTIEHFDFNCNYELESVDLSSLKTVGTMFRFDAQKSIQEVKLPNLESVGDGMSFYLNLALTNIEMPKLNTVTSVFMLLSDLKLPCEVACRFKNVSISGSITISSLLEESCDYDSDDTTQSFAGHCDSLGY